MYLIRLTLSFRRESIDLINDTHAIHRLVSSLKDQSSDTSRILWRLEESPGKQPVILIQVPFEPDINRLSKHHLFPKDSLISAKKVNLAVKKGNAYRFRLAANPIKREEKKRIPLSSLEDQERWIIDQGKSKGFSVSQLFVKKHTINEVKSPKAKKGIHNIVVYEGLLVVNDEDLFLSCIKNGIGKAKAFGCGMLSLAR